MRDLVFEPLNGYSRYQKLHVADLNCCRYSGPDIRFGAEDADSLTAEEFEVMEELSATIRQVYPDADVRPRVHRAVCVAVCGEECEKTVVRKSVLVTVSFGTVEVSREYAL